MVSTRAAALAKKELDEKKDDGNVSTSVARAASVSKGLCFSSFPHNFLYRV